MSTVEGLTHGALTVRVPASEIATWDAARIAAFFDGIAKTVRAVENNLNEDEKA